MILLSIYLNRSYNLILGKWEQKKNEKELFLEEHRSLLYDLRDLINNAIKKQYKGSTHDLLVNGHFNSSILNREKMFLHHAILLVRLIFLMAENMTKDHFIELFKEMAERIYNEANETNQFDT